MKSMIRRPSEYLPEGIPKKVSPYGVRSGPKTADNAPVSEFESPRLITAGKWHGEDETGTDSSRTS